LNPLIFVAETCCEKLGEIKNTLDMEVASALQSLVDNPSNFLKENAIQLSTVIIPQSIWPQMVPHLDLAVHISNWLKKGQSFTILCSSQVQQEKQTRSAYRPSYLDPW